MTMNMKTNSPKWSVVAGSVPGKKHIRNGIPCQDASLAGTYPRPFLAVCDGRGSSKMSHFGAEEAVKAAKDIIFSAEPVFKELLDLEDESSNAKLYPMAASILYRAVSNVQEKLSHTIGGKVEDYEFTFVIVIVGKFKTLIIHVGDGAVVSERNDEIILESAPVNGEFANMTEFVRYGHESKRQIMKLIPSKDLTGLAVFTDGTSAKMIEANTMKPSPGFKTIWLQMRENRFDKASLLKFLTESFWEPSVQDDRSLAVASLSEEAFTGKIQDAPIKTGSSIQLIQVANPDKGEQVSTEDDFSPMAIGNAIGKKHFRHSYGLSILLGTLILLIAANIAFSIFISGTLSRINKSVDEMNMRFDRNDFSEKFIPEASEKLMDSILINSK